MPEALTDAVVEVLRGSQAVTGLSVLRGASLIPPGDVVMADVAREGANPVIDALRDLGVHREGTVRIDPVDTWLSHAAFEAEREAPGASADAVVWTAGRPAGRTRTPSSTGPTCRSCRSRRSSPSMAIIVDSSDPRHRRDGPRARVRRRSRPSGVALVRRRSNLLVLALGRCCSGSRPASLATFLAGLLGRALGWVTYEDVAGPRPETAFIYRRPVDPSSSP